MRGTVPLMSLYLPIKKEVYLCRVKRKFLLKCMECDAKFFTEGESNFYRKNVFILLKDVKHAVKKRKARYEEQKLKEKELENSLSNSQFQQVEEEEIQLPNPNTVLFIIGNGFDLMHSVPSRYYNFRDSLGQRNKLREALEIYIKKDNLWADFEKSLAYLDDEAMLVTLDGWMDIFDVKEQHDDDFSEADFFMAAEAAMTPPQIIMSELPKRFRKWVDTLKPTISNRPLKRIINTQSMFINFNYTEFLETIYGVPKKNIFYIHGERRDKYKELILGHSGSANREIDIHPSALRSDHLRMKNQATYYLHETAGYQLGDYYDSTTKKFSDVIEANKETFASLLDIETVVVIGHSLSVVDYPSFKEIISNNKDMTNMKWYISWHNTSDIKRVEAFANTMSIQSKQIELFKV